MSWRPTWGCNWGQLEWHVTRIGSGAERKIFVDWSCSRRRSELRGSLYSRIRGLLPPVHCWSWNDRRLLFWCCHCCHWWQELLSWLQRTAACTNVPGSIWYLRKERPKEGMRHRSVSCPTRIEGPRNGAGSCHQSQRGSKSSSCPSVPRDDQKLRRQPCPRSRKKRRPIRRNRVRRRNDTLELTASLDLDRKYLNYQTNPDGGSDDVHDVLQVVPRMLLTRMVVTTGKLWSSCRILSESVQLK